MSDPLALGPSVVLETRPLTIPPPALGSSERILVRIAAYRDSECEWTLKDLFEKALRPERVFAAVCWQYSPEADSPDVRLHHFSDHVRLARVPAGQSQGVCWARHLCETLWRGEEYTLQIDSHSRFAPEWDRLLLEELAACTAPKPLLSSSPAPYTPPDRLAEHPRPAIRVARGFCPRGKLRFRGEYLDRAPEHPLNGAFVAAGFVFSASDVLQEVPYDPELYFDQEEAGYALRLYTHGWDVFSPSRTILYHYYNMRSGDAQSLRPLHWQDDLDWRKYDLRGQQRFDMLTGAIKGRGAGTPSLGIYGLGRMRSLAEYEAYSGIDFERKVASERALSGLFVRDLARYKTLPQSVDAAQPSDPARTLVQGDPDWDLPRVLPDDAEGPLELGEHDCVPFFILLDRHGRRREMQARGGLWTLLVVAPELTEQLAQQVRRYQQRARAESGIELVLISGQSAAGVADFDPGLEIWCDPGRELCRLFGAGSGSGPGPVVALINPNLRIERIVREGSLSERLLRGFAESSRIRKARKRRLVSAQAPVLLIPDALTPRECRKLVEYFHTHPRADGKVGAAPSVYRPSNKVRTDCFVEGEIRNYIDERLARRVLPEIEKVYGLAVTHRESYKIGCYDSARGGFFFRHRDNLDPALRYRRYAALVNLSEGFEGGELCFPEYSNVAYRPPLGHAVVFACSLVHEVERLRKGRRYILQGFLFGEQDAARCPRIISRADDEAWRLRASRVRLGLSVAADPADSSGAGRDLVHDQGGELLLG